MLRGVEKQEWNRKTYTPHIIRYMAKFSKKNNLPYLAKLIV